MHDLVLRVVCLKKLVELQLFLYVEMLELNCPVLLGIVMVDCGLRWLSRKILLYFFILEKFSGLKI